MSEKIFKYTPFLLAHCDRDGRYLFVSSSYAALLGRTPEDIIGTRVRDVVGEKAYEIMRPHIEAVLAGERVEYEAEIKIADAGPRDYHVISVPERDEKGEVAGYVVSVMDVTERNRAIAEKIRLERMVAQLSLPLEKAQIGIFDVDLDTGTVSCTPELEAIFGLEEFGLQRHADFRRLVHPDDLDEMLARRQEAITAHRTYQLEHRVVRPDGQVRWVRARAAAVYDKTNKPVRLMGSCVDITDLKASELEAERRRDELAHLMRVATVGGLCGGIAHELGQPLASILANAEAAISILANGNPDLGEVSEALNEVIQQDIRAGELIRRLRQLLQKREHGKLPIGLNDLIASTLQLLHFELTSRSIKVETELKSALPAASGDTIELQQVLINLLMNAIEAMVSVPPSQRKLTIISDEGADGFLTISVRDRGPGISSEASKELFTPFFTTKAGGLGLGLSICSTIITSHHGKLTLRNAPGGGVIATVSLPKDDR